VVAVKTTLDDANTENCGNSSNRMETSGSDERQQCIICNVLLWSGETAEIFHLSRTLKIRVRNPTYLHEVLSMKAKKANLHATTTLLFIVLPLLFATSTVAFSITRSSSSTTPSTLNLLIKPERQQHNQPIIARRRRHYHVMRTDGPDTTDNNSKMGYEEEDTTTNIKNKKKVDNVKILGICGGIGSGKSTACNLMVESLGCMALIDADKLAHSVYGPGSIAANEIIAEFGQDVVMLQPPHSSDDEDEGAESIVEIDRKKLGSIVFSNSDAMSKLEMIVWPHVRIKIEERIQDILQQQEQQSSDTNATIPNTTNNFIVVEAALLLETNWHDLFDGLWIIQSSCEVSKQRLIETRGMTEKEALIRIHAQDTRRGIGRRRSTTNSSSSDDDNKMKDDGVVTAIITNDGSLNDLEEALRRALYDPTSFKKERGEVNSNFLCDLPSYYDE